MVKRLCEPCSDINSSPETVFVIFGIPCLALGCICLRRRGRSRVGGSASTLQVQLTDNPVQGVSSTSPTRQGLSLQTTMERSDDAIVLARCVWQPFRILIGYGQIVNQISVVLAIEFPPFIHAAFEMLSILAVNLKQILQINCLTEGFFSFCEFSLLRIQHA